MMIIRFVGVLFISIIRYPRLEKRERERDDNQSLMSSNDQSSSSSRKKKKIDLISTIGLSIVFSSFVCLIASMIEITFVTRVPEIDHSSSSRAREKRGRSMMMISIVIFHCWSSCRWVTGYCATNRARLSSSIVRLKQAANLSVSSVVIRSN